MEATTKDRDARARNGGESETVKAIILFRRVYTHGCRFKLKGYPPHSSSAACSQLPLLSIIAVQCSTLYCALTVYRLSRLQITSIIPVNNLESDLGNLTTTALHNSTTALDYSTTALQHNSTTALQHYSTTALQHYSAAAQKHYSTTAQ